MNLRAEGRRQYGKAELAGQLRSLGVREGGVLLVHAAYRAVRPVDGGVLGLVEALEDALGPEGTLVVPSWTGSDDDVFNPAATAAAPDLGALADLFWRQRGTVRSDHPFAFAARGPKARHLTAGRVPLPPHGPDSPVGRVHELDGQVLLLGVGHEADTTLHLAELLENVPYRVEKYCTLLVEGRPVRVAYGENDHCCERFALADEWLRAAGVQSEGLVGHAYARLARSRDIVRIARDRLSRDPLVFLHPGAEGCGDCDAARRSVAA